MNYEKPRCCNCGKYCGYMCDSGTYYGCADYENPEPLDPDFFCKKCARKEYNEVKKEILKTQHGAIFDCSWWLWPNFLLRALKDTNSRLIRNSSNTLFILERQ